MAEDASVLLDYVGWKGKRSVHVVGVSLGGMIAMGALNYPYFSAISANVIAELASKHPDRIATLVLTVSTPGSRLPLLNLPPVGTTHFDCTIYLINACASSGKVSLR